MRVQIVDPPAYTPPYDRALCAALARHEVEAELITTRFPYGPVPAADGYRVSELFYPRAGRLAAGSPLRRPLRLAEHLPGMLRLRSHAAEADLVHLQWLALPALDRFLLPPRPRVLTVHAPPPPAGRAQVRLGSLLRQMDAVIAHTEDGARRLREIGADPRRVHRVPHGAFGHLTAQGNERPLPGELAAAQGPVILCFGLVRPYKGVDVLLEAFREVEGAELWVVGMPRMSLAPLRELADRCRSPVRFVARFITDPEIPAYFRRAELVVLPYRAIEQSGVLYTALAFGKPIIASAVGGFAEIGEREGAVRLVAPGDPAALASAITELLADPAARAELADAARAAAGGSHSWDSVAERTVAVYEAAIDRGARR